MNLGIAPSEIGVFVVLALVLMVLTAVLLYALYWVVRLGVRAGIADAQKTQ